MLVGGDEEAVEAGQVNALTGKFDGYGSWLRTGGCCAILTDWHTQCPCKWAAKMQVRPTERKNSEIYRNRFLQVSRVSRQARPGRPRSQAGTARPS